VEVQGIKETKILMGSQIAPGSFGWIVPFRRGGSEFARVGVSSKTSALPYLKTLFEELRSQGHLRSSNPPIRSWRIPISPLRRTFAERVLAVGDAAGQTKPTTGGGIFYGLLCAEAIAQTAEVAFEKGDFSSNALRTYEKKWWKRLGREIRIGTFFRCLAERLTDKEIDGLFRVVQSDGILRAVTHKARFDWHKDVICFALRHPALGRRFLKGLFRK
jgi:flavin-dependent dehydrogenase